MPAFGIVFILVFVLVIGTFIFTFAMMFSPKLRAKMMGKSVESVKYMMDEQKENLTDIATAAGDVVVDSKKNILDQHAGTLKEMSDTTADISRGGLEIAARAIKDGIVKYDDIFCKCCGAAIDKDSVFCKSCGKQQ
ncbi:MAG: zinc ribbon domain-containing protein [Clostridiales bacterium]|nr:zinc ribbon domain-containing protein [Clostridiales bacterium]